MFVTQRGLWALAQDWLRDQGTVAGIVWLIEQRIWDYHNFYNVSILDRLAVFRINPQQSFIHWDLERFEKRLPFRGSKPWRKLKSIPVSQIYNLRKRKYQTRLMGPELILIDNFQSFQLLYKFKKYKTK